VPIILNAFVNAEVDAFRTGADSEVPVIKKVSDTEWIMGNAIMEKRAPNIDGRQMRTDMYERDVSSFSSISRTEGREKKRAPSLKK